jgi:hypothetical protein
MTRKKPSSALIKKLLKENERMARVPQVGKDFIAFKKVIVPDQNGRRKNVAILTLYVPADAKRRNGNSRHDKLRVSAAFVVKAESRSGNPISEKEFFPGHTYNIIYSQLNKKKKSAEGKFRWVVGKWHKPAYKFAAAAGQCSHGLHAFISKASAKKYYL